MTIRCGFIGLGIMGKALAGNLAPKGLPTIVYDLDEAAIREVVAGGAKPAQSSREVAQNADVIGICVPADSHVRAVLCGEDGVFANAEPGAVVAIHSTVHPATIEEMAAEGASRGIAVLEVPVAGGPVRAAKGDAFYMVSGDEAAYEKARPYLEAAAGKITFDRRARERGEAEAGAERAHEPVVRRVARGDAARQGDGPAAGALSRKEGRRTRC